mmetsp:Transcript_14332/g.39037  ORF Transcript_14332/g.39037 Transcript_14332/m.39037 type:complete len:209 (+) Transcript_14332:2137-2763(+)
MGYSQCLRLGSCFFFLRNVILVSATRRTRRRKHVSRCSASDRKVAVEDDTIESCLSLPTLCIPFHLLRSTQVTLVVDTMDHRRFHLDASNFGTSWRNNDFVTSLCIRIVAHRRKIVVVTNIQIIPKETRFLLHRTHVHNFCHFKLRMLSVRIQIRIEVVVLLHFNNDRLLELLRFSLQPRLLNRFFCLPSVFLLLLKLLLGLGLLLGL